MVDDNDPRLYCPRPDCEYSRLSIDPEELEDGAFNVPEDEGLIAEVDANGEETGRFVCEVCQTPQERAEQAAADDEAAFVTEALYAIDELGDAAPTADQDAPPDVQ